MDTTKRHKGQPMQNELKETKNRQTKLDLYLANCRRLLPYDLGNLSIKLVENSKSGAQAELHLTSNVIYIEERAFSQGGESIAQEQVQVTFDESYILFLVFHEVAHYLFSTKQIQQQEHIREEIACNIFSAVQGGFGVSLAPDINKEHYDSVIIFIESLKEQKKSKR